MSRRGWRCLAVLGLVLGLVLLPADRRATALAAPPRSAEIVPGRVVLLFEAAVGATERAAILSRTTGAARVTNRPDHPHLAVLHVPAGQEQATARDLRRAPGVRAAAPDRRVRLASVPTDHDPARLASMTRIGAPAAWAAGYSGRDVTIAIVDTGLDIDHPEFAGAGKIAPPGVFVSSPLPSSLCGGPTTGDVLDNHGHGTHVAGIAAAGGNNGGIAGLAWEARIMPVKVLDACGAGLFSDIAIGIVHAATRGAPVVNVSAGGYLDPKAPDDAAIIAIMEDAVAAARTRGAIVIAAAGNDGRDISGADGPPYYPAAAAGAIAVAATTNDDGLALLSNFGPTIAVGAPGMNVYSTLPTYPLPRGGQGYGEKSGTSMAAPHVAGLAALLLQRDPALGPPDLRALLQGTAHNPFGAPLTTFGTGRIAADAALTRPPPTPIRYFAEGYTGGGFTQYLTLQNTADRPVLARLHFQYSGDGAHGPARRHVALPSSSRTTLVINEIVGPDLPVATIVAADHAGVFVERPIYFLHGGTVDGGHLGTGAPAPALTWHFAEGYTGPGFEQYLTIQNPGDQPAAVRLTFMTADRAPRTRDLTVAADSRATVPVHQPGVGAGPDQAVATTVESRNNVPIVVERPMYFTYAGALTGGHTVTGATGLGTTWYFAEGYTGTGFDQYLTIMNPGAADGRAVLTYYLGGGRVERREVPLPAARRVTVVVHDPPGAGNPGGLGRGHASGLRLETSVPTVAERPIYFRYTPAGAPGGDITGGHTTLGAPAPRQVWHFAEGYTGAGFDEYLALLNPGPTAASVRITYYLAAGTPIVKTLTVGAASRATVAVHEERFGVGRGQAVSAKVETLNGVGIVAERPIYFTYTPAGGTGGVGITGGHTALGQ